MSNMFYYDEPVKFHDKKDADGKPIKHNHPFKKAMGTGAKIGAGVGIASGILNVALLKKRKLFSDGLVAFHEKKDKDGNPKKHKHLGARAAGGFTGYNIGGTIGALAGTAGTIGALALKKKLRLK